MKAIASSTLRMAAEAIFRGSENDCAEADAEVEMTSNAKSNPLSIPKHELDSAASAFSAMSIDTVASSASVATSTEVSNSLDEANETPDNLPIINMAEVKEHCDPSDGWMVIYDRVYDVTDFLREVKLLRFEFSRQKLMPIS